MGGGKTVPVPRCLIQTESSSFLRLIPTYTLCTCQLAMMAHATQALDQLTQQASNNNNNAMAANSKIFVIHHPP